MFITLILFILVRLRPDPLLFLVGVLTPLDGFPLLQVSNAGVSVSSSVNFHHNESLN